jgi:hypothetical protein
LARQDRAWNAQLTLWLGWQVGRPSKQSSAEFKVDLSALVHELSACSHWAVGCVTIGGGVPPSKQGVALGTKEFSTSACREQKSPLLPLQAEARQTIIQVKALMARSS